MSAIARRVRSASVLWALCAQFFLSIPRDVRAQDLSAPERKKAQAMLRGVRKEIEERYYDSTFGGLNLQAAYDSADARIQSARALDGALAAIAWFTLELHDSHTFFVPPQQTVGVEYGWAMSMVGDSCFVRYVAPESDAERQGMHAGDQVLAVNGFAPTRENLWQINYLYQLLRPQRALHTTLRAPGGSPREIDIASTVRERTKIIDLTGADGGSDIGRLIRDGEKHLDDYRAETIEYGDRVLVWKMPTFAIPLDDVRDAIKRARRQKALVLDLRGNGGGYVAVMLELVKQLSRDSVIVGSLHERRKTTPMVAKGGRDDAFVGDVYVLVDSRSASASEILARALQLTKRGTVIGDRTAGAVMQAESRFSTLGIETKILYGAQVTNADIIMSDGARLEHVGVTPDELLLPSSTDLAAGRDVVLARALTLAGVPTDPTKAGQLYSRSSR